MGAPDILLQYGFKQVGHSTYKGHQYFMVLLGNHRISFSSKAKTVSVAYEDLTEYLNENIKTR